MFSNTKKIIKGFNGAVGGLFGATANLAASALYLTGYTLAVAVRLTCYAVKLTVYRPIIRPIRNGLGHLSVYAKGKEKHKVSKILRKIGDVNSGGAFGFGPSPLYKACLKGDSKKVKNLLDCGADPYRGYKGRTPIDVAENEGSYNLEILNLLQTKIADLDSERNSSAPRRTKSSSIGQRKSGMSWYRFGKPSNSPITNSCRTPVHHSSLEL